MCEKTLCQPDGSKSCSVCCGLFNLKDISRSNLQSFLSGDYPANLLNDVRDITSHICIYQSFIAPNRPGCSLHPKVKGFDGRNASLYGAKICEEFLCPAHYILNSEHKQILVDSVQDWYLYSIAILDPEGFIYISDLINYSSAEESDTKRTFLIREALSFHALMLSLSEKCHFYYSLAEYNQHKGEFSLRYNSEEQVNLNKHLMSISKKRFSHS